MTVEFKTGISFSSSSWSKYTHRKINQTWKLLPMREKNEDWEKQANTIIIELSGIKDLSVSHEEILIQILGKLKGLSHTEDFMFYRKTIFEIISLMEELK